MVALDPAADMPFPDSGQTARLWRAAILIVFGALVTLAGTFSIPPIDRDEARFAQATAQMLETGDYINIRFQDDERNKKPVGIYWLQALSVKAFSDVEAREIWAYRLPSFFAALMSIWLAYLLGCRLFGEEAGFLGTMLLIVAPSFSGEATIAKTDAALLTTVLLVQFAIARMYLGGFRRHQRQGFGTILLFWTGLSLGILIKGPITPMIAFLTLVTLCLAHFPRSKEQFLRLVSWAMSFRPFTGLFIMLVLVGPWMAAIGIETEGRFFAEAIGVDMLGKINETQESHSGPLGYYLIVVWIMFWPAALFLPLGIRTALIHLKHPGVILCLAWLIPTWIVFEIASTKLPHYTLPLYPALAFLIGFTVVRLAQSGRTNGLVISRLIGSVSYVIVGLSVAILFVLSAEKFGWAGAGWLEYVFAAATLSGVTLCLYQLWRFRLKTALISSTLLGGLMAWMLYEGMLARLDAFHLSPRLSATLAAEGYHPLYDEAPEVALLGYNEPSAVFLIGTGTRISTPTTAADWLRDNPGRIAVVESRQEEAFVSALEGTPVTKIAVLEGYNYSNAIDVILTLYLSE